jgi:aquaporin NIP
MPMTTGTAPRTRERDRRDGGHVHPPPGAPGLARRAGAEALAAFALVFAGCGAIVADARYDDALGTVGIALVFGLVSMAMVYATGHLSGAHINPAVTIAFVAARQFPPREAAAYVAAQLAGASLAALLLLALWPDQPAQLGATVPSVGAGSALVYELVLTAVLMFVITAVATDSRAVGAGAAIAIGATVGLDALFGGPITGASMNPARSFGPALATGEWHELLGLPRRADRRRSARRNRLSAIRGEAADARAQVP